MREALHLDHTGHIVRDLGAAAALYRRMGFRLTPLSHHQTPGRDGCMVPAGTANQCAMLPRGYLEIMGVTDRSADSYSAREAGGFLDAFEGLHLLAFGTADRDATQARLERDGVACAPRELGRMIDTATGPAEARFRLLTVAAMSDESRSFFFIEHATRDLLWQPDLTVHENGALGLAELVIVTDDPGGLEQTLNRTFGVNGTPEGPAIIWRLDRSALVVTTAADADDRFGVSVARRDIPHAAGQVIEVADMAALAGLLQRNAVPFCRHRDRLTVAPADAMGVALQFAPAGGA
ncbi:MAG: VOC family protein [Rubellimicrobium sp.]|nr:VOC family protein [Rubellimicrobium sp.]